MLTREEISQLTSDELKKLLKDVKISCGPITSTTRKIYGNRLFSYYEVQRKKQNLVKEPSNEETVTLKTEAENKKDDDKLIEKIAQNNDESAEKIVEAGQSNGTLTNGICEGIDENHFSIGKTNIKLNTNVENNNDKTDSPKSPQKVEEEIGDGFYYGVWIPYSPTRINFRNKAHVFLSKKSTLSAMKKLTGSRFKQFKTREEAEKFSLTEPNLMSVDSIITMVANTVNNKDILPKPELLKVPTIQELQKFRKHIEENDFENVQKCLANPRYLVNSKDFPVVVHEGSRLNSLHVAVKFERLKICEEIMNQANSPNTYELLYPELNEEDVEFRRSHVENLYLNSPEKIICDTSLHLACKYGLAPIVKFLLSFPATNLKAVNKDGKLATDIICSRASIRGPKREEKTQEILDLFQDKAYIPLYSDSEDMAKVGQPIVTISGSVNSVLCKDMRACVGPCSPCQADKIYHMWRKIPREKQYHSIVRSDYEKGMERVGRTIAAQENLPYSEYWDFLESHVNLCSVDGLEKLEKYIRDKSERRRLCKTVMKKHKSSGTPVGRTKTRQFISDSDEIKRRLSFESESSSKTSNNPNNKHQIDGRVLSPRRKISSSTEEECYCRCGKLLGNCDDCAVDIDVENLIVSFRMCCTIKDDSFAGDDSLDGDPDSHVTELFDVVVESPNDEFDSPTAPKDLPHVFIYGDYPSKKDLDVLRAIGDYQCDLNSYPYIGGWLKRVTRVSHEDRESWPTPGSPRYLQRINKHNLWTA